jgi:hypothetical protein
MTGGRSCHVLVTLDGREVRQHVRLAAKAASESIWDELTSACAREVVLVSIGAVAESHDFAGIVESPDVDLVSFGDSLAGRFDSELDIQQRDDNVVGPDYFLRLELVKVHPGERFEESADGVAPTSRL